MLCFVLLQGISHVLNNCRAPAPAASGGIGGGFPARLKRTLHFSLHLSYSFLLTVCLICVEQGNSMPVFVERLRHFSQDPYQRE